MVPREGGPHIVQRHLIMSRPLQSTWNRADVPHSHHMFRGCEAQGPAKTEEKVRTPRGNIRAPWRLGQTSSPRTIRSKALTTGDTYAPYNVLCKSSWDARSSISYCYHRDALCDCHQHVWSESRAYPLALLHYSATMIDIHGEAALSSRYCLARTSIELFRYSSLRMIANSK